MGTFMLEGFEHLPSGFEVTQANMKNYLLCLENMPWASGLEALVTAAGRIDGNCLRFTRDENLTDNNAMLGFSFIPKQKVVAGFAVKFNEVPAQAIPLLSFRFHNGSESVEQFSLWCSTDGRLFSSLSDAASSLTASMFNMNAVSDAATINIMAWTYIEVMLTYHDSNTPILNVNVNGAPVFSNLVSTTFMKVTDQPWLSEVWFVNPASNYFEQEYEMEIDDIYLNDSSFLGPQWVFRLDNQASIDGTFPVPPSYYTESPPVSPSDWGDFGLWGLANIPAGAGSISAIGVTILAQLSTELIDGVEWDLSNAAHSNVRAAKKATISNAMGVTCLRSTGDTLPNGVSADASNLHGYIKSSKVLL